MGNTSRAGFTIIETVLFLAVSGLLILVIISGAGININIQRYRDAVETFKTELQQQYADLGNVQNSREAKVSCGATAKPTDDATNGDIRGQSDCTIAGKYMRIDGANVATYTVLAYGDASKVAPGQNDVTVMKSNFVYNTADTPDDDSDLPWGTRIAWPTTAGTESIKSVSPRQLGILFIRSPYTGQLYTFTSNDIPAKDAITSSTFSAMMFANGSVPGTAARTVCIDSQGLFVDANQSIYINADASGPSSIETATNQVLSTKGVTTQC